MLFLALTIPNRSAIMSKFKSVFGKKLRILREMAGMTQVQLGKAIGYTSTGTVSLIESGKRRMMPDEILRAAEILNVDPTVLMSASAAK